MRQLRINFTVGLVMASAVFLPAQSFGASAETYVKNLAGNWKGGGIITVNGKGKKVKLRCSSRNVMNLSSRKIVMRGRCASSAGTRPLRGVIAYSADGKSLTQASFKIAGRGGGSKVSFSGNSLTLAGSIKRSSGKTVKTRSVIRGSGSRFSVTLYIEEEGVWKKRGALKFRK